MASQVSDSQERCSVCGALLSISLRYCPSCHEDAGAPNVRLCRRNENIEALTVRYNAAKTQADTTGYSGVFNELEDLIKLKSGVVICLPVSVARKLFEDPISIYSNYEQLVGAGIRKPATFDADRHRCAVGGLLFGSYAEKIVYGALSLTGKGLPTYGEVHCRLRSIAIERRTSFLETNSYGFVTEHSIAPGGELPFGYTSCWVHRHFLVMAKHANCLDTGQVESDWQNFLIHSDGQNRENDDFIEAHIFEFFDRNAVESIEIIADKHLSREAKLDSKIALSKFKKLKGI